MALGGLALASCPSGSPPRPLDAEPAAWASRLQTTQFHVADEDVDTRFVTRDHFIAAIEMQLSGEPFAQAMGRNLKDYSRDHIPPDLYFSPEVNPPGTLPQNLVGIVDLPGFSSGIESYEYSKQPMNNVNLESGAGTSLLFGPLLNPAHATGSKALQAMRRWVQSLAHGSHAFGRLVTAEASRDNPLGWPGLWPTLQPFASFDPHVQATSSVAEHCSITSDDDPGQTGAVLSNDYECDYTTLNLSDRDRQVDKLIDPGSSGWAAWKSALWTLNYLQVMHDAQENPISAVPSSALGLVGQDGNTVLGSDACGATSCPAVAGTYLGSSDIEGFQAGMFILMMDNQAEQWLTELTTHDGATFSGFKSLSEALAYSTSDPLRFFAPSLAVTETSDASGFPRVARFSIRPSAPSLLDVAGMLGAYATLYALTDHTNPAVGGSQAARAYFDGSPFADDDQTADGEATTHDRTLSMIRVLVVDMLRMHLDPGTGLLADTSSLEGGEPIPGSVLSPDVAAYTLLSLRTARRALDGVLSLYGNTTPDIVGAPTPLDDLPFVDGRPFGEVLDQLIASMAGVFLDRLTLPGGEAYAGWDLAYGRPMDAATSLDAHTAAVRGLLVAYLATGDTRFRERALAVFARVEGSFYDPAARVYRPTLGDTSDRVTFTARRFALLQAMLRDVYELVAVDRGYGALRAEIQDRVGRLHKLVLNGWDDRNLDEQVDWPGECVRYRTDFDGPGARYGVNFGGQGHTLPLGGLQMAERTLTGESGSLSDIPTLGPRIITTDREQDCVPEISAAGLPSALASSITFTLSPYTP